MKQRIIVTVLLLFIAIQTASAVATLSIGTISYDSTVVKDESLTIRSSVTASSVTGTLTVDVTLKDNSGLFNIPTPVSQLQFTTDGTKEISWTITATTSGTNPAAFTITATGDDNGNPANLLSSAVTVKDRPVITVSSTANVSTIASGGTASLGYVVSNGAATGAADATNVNMTLALPTGWSLVGGAVNYELGTIAPGASKSGSWIVRADSPGSSNIFTLNSFSTIPGGIISKTVSISGPSSGSGNGGSTGSGGSSGSSGGGGGGGGGGSSGENYTNIVLNEKYDLIIYKDKVTSYKFTNPKNPVMFVNITGNVNTEVKTTMVEVLKSNSSLVKIPAYGNVYKNFNIWVGSSGFGDIGNKNIKEGIISFRVENSWIKGNNIESNDIRLVTWDKTKWIELETREKSSDNAFTYFEAKTLSFSHFAISKISEAPVPKDGESIVSSPEKPQSKSQETAQPAPTKKAYGFNVMQAAVILSAVYLFIRTRR